LTKDRKKTPAVKWKKDPSGKWPTQDPKVIKEWWTKFPEHGVGSPVLDKWWVLDIDLKDNKDGFATMEELGFKLDDWKKKTYWVETENGGVHLYFRWTDDCKFSHGSDVLGDGVDVRVPNQSYVRIPPTKGFVKHNRPVNIKAAPKKLIGMLNKQRKATTSKPSGDSISKLRLSEKDLREVLFKLDPVQYRSRDQWLQKMIEVHSACSGEDWGKEIFREWSGQDEYEWSDDPDATLDKEWKTLNPNGTRSAGSLLFEARKQDVMSGKYTPEKSEMPEGLSYDIDAKTMSLKKTDNNFFMLTTQPIPFTNTIENVPDKEINPLYDLVYYNELREAILYKRNPPWAPDDETWAHREIDGSVFQEYKLYIERVYGINYPYGSLERFIEAIAKRSRFNPVTTYLENLPEWDGVNRLDTWLDKTLGCGTDEYTNKVSRYSLIAAVARAFKPGCKVDTMVIIDGPQGQKKSQVLEALGGEFYSTPHLNESGSGDKDNKLSMRSGWIVEWQEINIFNTRSASEVKRMLSTATDVFRVPYGRGVQTFPRRFTIWATINSDTDGKMLTDPTGNRRFWPVTATCGKDAGNTEWMKANRDQLWAQATKAFKDGEHWWFKGKDEGDLAEAVQFERTTQDEWHDAIAMYIQNSRLNSMGKVIKLADIFEHVLHVPLKDRKRGASVRIGKIMERLGYEYKRTYVNGVKVTAYVTKGSEVYRKRKEREAQKEKELDEVDALE
jgi:predicted P-loop ATPase